MSQMPASYVVQRRNMTQPPSWTFSSSHVIFGLILTSAEREVPFRFHDFQGMANSKKNITQKCWRLGLPRLLMSRKCCQHVNSVVEPENSSLQTISNKAHLHHKSMQFDVNSRKSQVCDFRLGEKVLLGHRHGKKRFSSESPWIIIRRTSGAREPQMCYDLFWNINWHYIEYHWIKMN